MYVSKYTGNIDFVWAPTSSYWAAYGDDRIVESVTSCKATHRIKVGDRYFYRTELPLYDMSDSLYHQAFNGSVFICDVKGIVAGHESTDWNTVKHLYYGDELNFTKEEQDKCLSFLVPHKFFNDHTECDDLWGDGKLSVQVTDRNSPQNLKDILLPLIPSYSMMYNGVPCLVLKCDGVLVDYFKCVVVTDTLEKVPSFVVFDHSRSSGGYLPSRSGKLHEVYGRSIDSVEEAFDTTFFVKSDINFPVWTDALVEQQSVRYYSTEEYEGIYSAKEECEEALCWDMTDERIGTAYYPVLYGDVQVLGVCTSEFDYTAQDGSTGNEWVVVLLLAYNFMLCIKKPDFVLAYEKKVTQ